MGDPWTEAAWPTPKKAAAEPISTANGNHVPSPGYWHRLREISRPGARHTGHRERRLFRVVVLPAVDGNLQTGTLEPSLPERLFEVLQSSIQKLLHSTIFDNYPPF